MALGNVNYRVDYEEQASRGFPWVGAGQKNTVQIGYAIGGGLEYAFTGNLSVKAEYLYYNLGDALLNTTLINGRGEAFTHRIETGAHIGRLGLNYRL